MTTGIQSIGPSSMHMRRTRGSLTGIGLILLGAWGALVPFIGPYLDYAYTPTSSWTLTGGRLFLQVIPGAITFFAGIVLVGTTHRVTGTVAGWLAIVCGAWFVVGPLLAPLWQSDYVGHPTGGTLESSVQQIGMFYGLGAAIILLASFALGRFSVRDSRPAHAIDRSVDRPDVVDERRTPAESAEPLADDRYDDPLRRDEPL